ncbi:GntR family transcriptional regulator [Gulosibacter faecalis]|uniref:GntR family transcriptional regulator n=1 Tax=Gulosibacter faecalis TaxID=272240 RepID=A0ABW5V0G0_9MICO|nr:GntR family transcriptional regulator [Gulosibacter faecalis]
MGQELQTVSVVDAAANRLRDDLFAGEYTAGQELKDTSIANEFGIARPTARMAVQQLINEGLLVRPAGYSARVRQFDAGEVNDLYRIRRLVEVEALTLIHGSSHSLEGVQRALVGFEGLKEDSSWPKISHADVAFHQAVVDAAGSPRLSAFFATLVSETRLLNALLKYQYQGGAELYAEHAHLYDMLAEPAKLPDLIEAWQEHLEVSHRFIDAHQGSEQPS